MVAVEVLPSTLSGRVKVPPSKSYTHRAVALASLAEGASRISNPLLARDTLATVRACRALGAEVKEEGSTLIVLAKGEVDLPENVIDVENSGTTMRLMSSMSSLAPKGHTVLTGDESVRRRPMQPLLDALGNLGVECWSARMNGAPPIIVKGGGLRGGATEISGGVSSQFISSILIAAPLARQETHLKVVGRMVSRPYVEATLTAVRRFQGLVEVEDGAYRVPPSQRYAPQSFVVPGDYSSASFMLAAGALAGGEVTVEGLDFELPQADSFILEVLNRMGAKTSVDKAKGQVTVGGGSRLEGGCFDISDSPDLLPVLGVLSMKAMGRVEIRGVRHARFKETDRIAVMAGELRKAGAGIQELEDGLIVDPPSRLERALLDAHGDHRMFMALLITGLLSPKGCVVEGAESVDVSYPSFISDIASLGARIKVGVS